MRYPGATEHAPLDEAVFGHFHSGEESEESEGDIAANPVH
jgi:hypothetical protein